MNSITSSGPAATDAPAPTPEGHKRHFDTFETQFFKQGDDEGSAPEVDRFEDLEDGGKRRRFAPSRQFVVSAAVGSACLAVLGCVALWRSGNRPNSTTEESVVASPQPVSAKAAVAAAPGAAAAPEPLPAAAAPVPAPSPSPAQAELAPAVATTGKAEPSAQAAAAAAPVVAEKAQPSAPSAAAPVAAEKPAPRAEQHAAGSDTAAWRGAGEAGAARARCKQAVSRRHAKEIQSLCEEAFMADPGAADIAVLLAKTEYDRGRSVQAAAWSRKALAVDPNAADAYVFIGGAEQSAGRNKAAKEAYKRYLQLAPTGRYAADLRAIVGSL